MPADWQGFWLPGRPAVRRPDRARGDRRQRRGARPVDRARCPRRRHRRLRGRGRQPRRGADDRRQLPHPDGRVDRRPRHRRRPAARARDRSSSTPPGGSRRSPSGSPSTGRSRRPTGSTSPCPPPARSASAVTATDGASHATTRSVQRSAAGHPQQPGHRRRDGHRDPDEPPDPHDRACLRDGHDRHPHDPATGPRHVELGRRWHRPVGHRGRPGRRRCDRRCHRHDHRAPSPRRSTPTTSSPSRTRSTPTSPAPCTPGRPTATTSTSAGPPPAPNQGRRSPSSTR